VLVPAQHPEILMSEHVEDDGGRDPLGK